MSRSVPARREIAADPYYSRAVAKAFEALDVVRGSGEAAPLHVVANSIGLSKASATRILYTLESLGYIRKTDSGYVSADRPAPARIVQALLECAAAPLRRLVQSTGETASLAALFENHIEVVLVVESPHPIRMANTKGRILPPHASSMGKAVTAFQREEVRERLLRSYGPARFTSTTICDRAALDDEFARIRKQGFAEDWSESTPEGVCFGAPILDAAAHAQAAVSVSMPKMRLQGDEHQRILIAAALETAQDISRSMGESRRGSRKS